MQRGHRVFDKLCIGVDGQRREETGNRTIPIIGNVWSKVFINPSPSLHPVHNRFYSLVAQLQRGNVWSGSAALLGFTGRLYKKWGVKSAGQSEIIQHYHLSPGNSQILDLL